jgi:hypothetical protein
MQQTAQNPAAEQPLLLARLPFEGFYGSFLDEESDRCEERFAEDVVAGETSLYEDKYKALSASDVCEALYWASDYRKGMQVVARAVVDGFAERVKDEYGLDLELKFESLTHPREYNFETDKLYVHIPLEQVKTLLERVRDTTLQATIEDRFTSRSGFFSFYSNDIEDWLAKPLQEWDHNEVGTLLHALIAEDLDWDVAICGRLSETNLFDDAMDAAVDWEDLERRLDSKLAETLQAAQPS